jgi:hypothetical protein
MFVNTQKGSYGMFSKSGKRTLEKYQILLKKDEIINGIDKKIKVNDFYTPDQANNLDTQEDEFKVYSQDPQEKQNLVDATLKKHKNKLNNNKLNKKSKSLLKEHKSKKHENPPCNKYNPNWDYINKKLSWGVKWNTMKPREFSMVSNRSLNPNAQYNIYQEDFHVDSKTFIDFKKQTKRHSFAKRDDFVSKSKEKEVEEKKILNISSQGNYYKN